MPGSGHGQRTVAGAARRQLFRVADLFGGARLFLQRRRQDVGCRGQPPIQAPRRKQTRWRVHGLTRARRQRALPAHQDAFVLHSTVSSSPRTSGARVTRPSEREIAESLIKSAKSLSSNISRLKFGPPVAYVY